MSSIFAYFENLETYDGVDKNLLGCTSYKSLFALSPFLYFTGQKSSAKYYQEYYTELLTASVLQHCSSLSLIDTMTVNRVFLSYGASILKRFATLKLYSQDVLSFNIEN